MRIAGGEWRGRALKVPPGDAVRPTQDRVREALFSMLMHETPGARFLDLFAGAGGVGLEALSRGATDCTFVELAPRHLAILRANVSALGADARCQLVRADAFAWLETFAGAPFDVAFADPPYELGVQRGYAAMLATLAERNVVRAGGLFVAELTSRQNPDESLAWDLCRDRVYGQTRLVVYRRKCLVPSAECLVLSNNQLPTTKHQALSTKHQKYDILSAMAEKISVYPGTFDPMTRGHFDLITRAAGLYDRLVVAVAATSAKSGALFDAQHRIDMIREDVEKAGLANVEVDILDTLLVDFCRKIGARVVIRGVRVYSDFEYEFQMALTNRRMAPEIETLFMMPSENLAYVTASTVREIARYGGDTSPFVTPAVQRRLEAKG